MPSTLRQRAASPWRGLASIPLFLFLLVQTYRAGLQHWRLSLLLLYVCIALSDFLDGWLARKAGAPSQVWGQIDATADIAFTSLSLATAAWLGRVGPWVPAGVAILGGRFLLRNLLPPANAGKGAWWKIGPAKPQE